MIWLPNLGTPARRLFVIAGLLTLASAIVIVAFGGAVAGIAMIAVAALILILAAPRARDHLRDLTGSDELEGR